MNRDELYEALQEERFNIMRRDCTPRVMQVTNVLLDQLLEIQYEEALVLLQEG